MNNKDLEVIISKLEEVRKAPPSTYWAVKKRIMKETNICNQFLAAYEKSKNQEFKLIDFNITLCSGEVKRVLMDLKRFNIKEFTISAESDIIQMLKDFVDLGCEIVGIETIKKSRGDVPAIKLSVKEQ